MKKFCNNNLKVWVIFFLFCKAKWVPELRATSSDAKILLVGTQSDLRQDPEKLDGQSILHKTFETLDWFGVTDLKKKKMKPIQEDQAFNMVKKLKLRTYKECSAVLQVVSNKTNIFKAYLKILKGPSLSNVFIEAIFIALEQPEQNMKWKFWKKCSIM